MADKLMYIPYDDTQNYPFFRLQAINQNSIKVPKVVDIQLNKLPFKNQMSG